MLIRSENIWFDSGYGFIRSDSDPTSSGSVYLDSDPDPDPILRSDSVLFYFVSFCSGADADPEPDKSVLIHAVQPCSDSDSSPILFPLWFLLRSVLLTLFCPVMSHGAVDRVVSRMECRNTTQPNPTQPNPTQLNPTKPNPTQPNPTQPNLTACRMTCRHGVSHGLPPPPGGTGVLPGLRIREGFAAEVWVCRPHRSGDANPLLEGILRQIRNQA